MNLEFDIHLEWMDVDKLGKLEKQRQPQTTQLLVL